MSEFTSSIRFYANLPIRPEKNFSVDDIDDYLASLPTENSSYPARPSKSAITSNFMYIRPALEISIKIRKEQLYLELNKYAYNYMTIQHVGTSQTKYPMYYYFIINARQIATDTLEFDLRMDVLNTFKWGVAYEVSKRTKVMREHKNRFAVAPTHNEQETLHPTLISTTALDQDYYEYYVRAVIGDYDKYIAVLPATLRAFDTIHQEITNTIEFDEQQDEDGMLVFYFSVVSQDDYENIEFELDYSWSNQFSHYAIVDHYSEGITPSHIKENDTLLEDKLNTLWYLIYKTKVDIDEQTPSAEVSCGLMPENFMKVEMPTSQFLITDSVMSNENYFTLISKSTPNTATEFPNNILEPLNPDDILLEINGSNRYNISASYDFLSKSHNYFTYIIAQFKRVGGQSNYDIKIQRLIYQFYWSDIELRWKQIPSYPKLETIASFTNANCEILSGVSFNYYPTSAELVLSDFLSFNNPFISMATITHPTTTTVDINGFGQYDRTDTKIYKIIQIPYAPDNYDYDEANQKITFTSGNWSYNTTESDFQYTDLNEQLINNIRFDVRNPISNSLFMNLTINVSANRYLDDTKLLHSDFSFVKFVYDSFNFIFQRENTDVEEILNNMMFDYSKFSVNFVMTNTMNSKFLFEFPEYKLLYSTQDYDNILIINRNNDVVIYNYNYLTYLRTAYNYDMKAKARSIESADLSGWLNVYNSATSGIRNIANGVGQIGAGNMGGVLTAVSGLATGAVGTFSAVRNLQMSIENIEDTYASKIQAMAQQTFSASGCDDLDLMNYYSKGKAHLISYGLLPRTKKALNDLFHYFGYATDENKVPNVSTRYRFNFLQCDLVINGILQNVKTIYMDEIMNKFRDGVSFIHHNKTDSLPWDFEQVKENWETSLLS